MIDSTPTTGAAPRVCPHCHGLDGGCRWCIPPYGEHSTPPLSAIHEVARIREELHTLSRRVAALESGAYTRDARPREARDIGRAVADLDGLGRHGR